MKKFLIIGGIVLIAIVGIWWARTSPASEKSEQATEIQEPKLREETITIESGTVFSVLMEDAGIGTSVHRAIYDAAEDVYSLAQIRAGEDITLFFDPETNELVQLMYPISTLEELYVTRDVVTGFKPVTTEVESPAIVADDIPHEEIANTVTEPERVITWHAERKKIEYDVSVIHKSGTIDSSLYVAALEQDMDERAVVTLANVFQWSIDFAWGTRKGDTFSTIYEERYRNGEYIMPGKILAAEFVNDGTPYYAYHFDPTPEDPTNDDDGYYDQDGNSVQKMFLKAPVEFKYISSGFTTNARFVSNALGWTSSHKAIDYAASLGTPARAVGSGTVVVSGWNGPYGNFVSIRHNETYTTNYAHLSKIYVSKGEHVNQNQTIGLVGSTGYSTGPHLHYEMVKNGVKINPLTEVLPPGPSLTEETKPQFFKHIAQFDGQL